MNRDHVAEDVSNLYSDTAAVPMPSAPSIMTLVDMLGTLAMHGNLGKTDLYRRTTVSYGQFMNYLAWMKWKNLIVEENSHIAINERGRTLYKLLA
jgi:hypothetical protein